MDLSTPYKYTRQSKLVENVRGYKIKLLTVSKTECEKACTVARSTTFKPYTIAPKKHSKLQSIFSEHVKLSDAGKYIECKIVKSESSILLSKIFKGLKKNQGEISHQLYNRISPLVACFDSTYSGEVEEKHHERIDKSILRRTLTSLYDGPCVSLSETKMTFVEASENIPAGKLDLLVGAQREDNLQFEKYGKVMLHVGDATVPIAIYSPVLGESKGCYNTITSGAFSQAILELLVFSLGFKASEMQYPLINILGNRFEFQAILYFPKYDFIFATDPLYYRTQENGFWTTSLAVLLNLLNHRKPSATRVQKCGIECGWRDASSHVTYISMWIKPEKVSTSTTKGIPVDPLKGYSYDKLDEVEASQDKSSDSEDAPSPQPTKRTSPPKQKRSSDDDFIPPPTKKKKVLV